ncbi:MAG: ComEC/Rec2 family competence protein [Armatimonadota bacterium]
MRRTAQLTALFLVAVALAQRSWRHNNAGAPPPAKSAARQLTAWFINVGQGDATLIRTPRGQFILIDAGPPEAERRVLSFLRRQRVSEIALAVASHPHADHIGGMTGVLRRFRVRRYMDPAFPYPSPIYADLLEAVKRQEIPFTRARQGVQMAVGGVRLTVLAPRSPFIQGTESDANNNSAVMRLSMGRVSMLFMGDAQREEIAQLLSTRANLRCQLLKVSHHGSVDGTTDELLSRVGPETAVVFCGRRNPYGHPHVETMQALRQAKCRVYRTDINGTITAVTDGHRITIEAERGKK